MEFKIAKPAFWAALVILLCPALIWAQSATLSGTATDVKGKPVANVTVSLKPSSGHAIEARTDQDGNYSIPNLASGDYILSASGNGMRAKPFHVTITTAPHQTVDLLMKPDDSGEAHPQPPPNAVTPGW